MTPLPVPITEPLTALVSAFIDAQLTEMRIWIMCRIQRYAADRGYADSDDDAIRAAMAKVPGWPEYERAAMRREAA